MDEFREDVKEIRKDIATIKETLAVNTASLVEHTKRTDYNERRIEAVEKWLLGLLTAILIAIISHKFF